MASRCSVRRRSSLRLVAIRRRNAIRRPVPRWLTREWAGPADLAGSTHRRRFFFFFLSFFLPFLRSRCKRRCFFAADAASSASRCPPPPRPAPRPRCCSRERCVLHVEPPETRRRCDRIGQRSFTRYNSVKLGTTRYNSVKLGKTR